MTMEPGKKLCIGLVLEQDISCGGGFHSAMSMIDWMHLHFGGYRLCVVNLNKNNYAAFSKRSIEVIHVDVKRWWFPWILFRKNIWISKLLCTLLPSARYNPFEKKIREANIDLIYFMSPSYEAFLIEETNYIMTVWDLCHRDCPQFPEVRGSSDFERREHFLNTVLPRAHAVITNSEQIKQAIEFYYRVNPRFIHVIPFFTHLNSSSDEEAERSIVTARKTDVLKRYNLPKDFIFYPAKYWSHKNHAYLFAALKAAKEKYGLIVHLVLTGEKMGGGSSLNVNIRKFGLSGQVLQLGLLPSECIAQLYQAAKAVVMPTYFGPTNLLPLEAFAYETPIFYSDLPGFMDEYESAVIPIDLSSPSDLANKLNNLYQGSLDVDHYLERGKAYLHKQNNGQNVAVMQKILSKYEVINRCFR